jgi:hypothetical protein
MSNTIQNAIKQDPKTDLGYALYNLYSYVKAIESKQFKAHDDEHLFTVCYVLDQLQKLRKNKAKIDETGGDDESCWNIDIETDASGNVTVLSGKKWIERYYQKTLRRDISFDMSPRQAVGQFYGIDGLAMYEMLEALGYNPSTFEFYEQLELHMSRIYKPTQVVDFEGFYHGN